MHVSGNINVVDSESQIGNCASILHILRARLTRDHGIDVVHRLMILRNRHQDPLIMGFEDEAEQYFRRSYRQTNGGSIRPHTKT